MDFDNQIPGFVVRAQRAGRDIMEALSVVHPPAQLAPQPAGGAMGSPHPPPQPMAPNGAQPSMRPPGQPMPDKRPALTALATMPDFRSPPMAAALQGAAGREGPVGFAAGGRVDFAVRR